MSQNKSQLVWFLGNLALKFNMDKLIYRSLMDLVEGANVAEVDSDFLK